MPHPSRVLYFLPTTMTKVKSKKPKSWKGWPGVTPEEYEELKDLEQRVLSGEEATVPLDEVMRPTLLAVVRRLKKRN